MKVDAHHHFWDPTRATYPWMVGEALDPVRRPFTPDDLAPELAAQDISRFVLDHIAKPRIAEGNDPEWRERMPALAALPNVAVKLSGMVTEANWASWTPADLRPFLASVVDWFGAGRLMFGSDWPVCLLATSYDGVVTGLEEALGPISPDDAERIFGLNAVSAYRLRAR